MVGGYVHRWVGGSVAHWLEPSIHKQLLISTNRVQIKKTTEKGKGGKKIRIKTNRRVQIKEKYDFFGHPEIEAKGRPEGERDEKGRPEGERKEKGNLMEK